MLWCDSDLLTGGCKEQVCAVEVIRVILRMPGRVESPLEAARAAVGEVAQSGPRGSWDLIL